MGGIRWYPGKRAVLGRAMASALSDAAKAVLDDANDSGVVPHSDYAREGKQAGLLQESGHVEVEGSRVRVVYDTDYAAAAYFHPGWRFRTGVNPSARGRWLDQYLAKGAKRSLAHDAYMRALRKRGKGVLF